MGEFPVSGAFDALIDRASIERAFARFRDPAFQQRANNHQRHIAADIARGGADSTCILVGKGPVVESITNMREPDLMATARHLHALAIELGQDVIGTAHPTDEHRFAARCRITVDDAGLGGGVTDRLKELGARVSPFVGAEAPSPSVKRKYLNRRAEAYMTLREKLLRNTVAIVPDERLAEELMATTVSLTASGKIAIEPKDEIRSKLGRSPDRADALSMAFADPSSIATTHIVYT